MKQEIIDIASSFTAYLAPYLPILLAKTTTAVEGGFETFVKEGGKHLFQKIFPGKELTPTIVNTVANKMNDNKPDIGSITDLSETVAKTLEKSPELHAEVKKFVKKAEKRAELGNTISYNKAEKMIVINKSKNIHIKF